MQVVKSSLSRFAGSLFALLFASAHAQRVEENAVVQAQDAFGLTVGEEEIGLYSSREARGFSPVEAGNLVIEGLYFDQQTFEPTSRILESSTLRVGLAAQSFPLAAPTGVVDYTLRKPGDRHITSISLGAGPFENRYLEVDAQLPLLPSLNAGFGAGYEYNQDYELAEHSFATSLGGILKWKPTTSSEVVPFLGWNRWQEHEERAIVYLGGSALPPEFKQRKLPGQPWTRWGSDSIDAGVLGSVDLAHDWSARAGLFISRDIQSSSYYENLYDAEPSGVAQYSISAVPKQKAQAYSGEFRLTKILTSATTRHTIHFIARARDRERIYGGDDEHFIATTRIGAIPAILESEKPDFQTNSRNRVHTTQRNTGVTYALMWKDVGELGVGLQHARVKRDLRDAVTAVSSTEGQMLYSGSAALSLGSPWTLFASYSRGLEEGGIAPYNAANAREAAPLVLSRQVDAGIRYVIRPGASAVLSVFEIEKPYYGLASTNLYTELADVTHRGVEVSVAGELARGLHVVAGYAYLKPRLRGPAVDEGSLGRIPIGPIPRIATLDVSYGPPRWNGLTFETSAGYNSSYVASQDNVLTVPSATVIDVGFRYRFALRNAPISLRLQARNINDDRTWHVKSSGEARPTDGRHYVLTLTTDLGAP